MDTSGKYISFPIQGAFYNSPIVEAKDGFPCADQLANMPQEEHLVGPTIQSFSKEVDVNGQKRYWIVPIWATWQYVNEWFYASYGVHMHLSVGGVPKVSANLASPNLCRDSPSSLVWRLSFSKGFGGSELYQGSVPERLVTPDAM